MGLWAGGAVFIRLPEPFAAGAGIDHLIQDKMVHIGGSSGIAVFSGFLVCTIFQPLAAKGFACKSYCGGVNPFPHMV